MSGKPFLPCPKPSSRLQARKAEDKVSVVDEKAFKLEVWTRDSHQCRKCERHVVKGVGRFPIRGEVHHIHGRAGDLRYDSRAALLLCLECHEQVTGRVAEKWIVEPKPRVGGFFVANTKHGKQECIDARKPVQFVKVV